jgi:glutathione S-transferase
MITAAVRVAAPGDRKFSQKTVSSRLATLQLAHASDARTFFIWFMLLSLQVPYIEDPNTGVKMFESAEIIEYLKTTYSLYSS